MGTGVFEIFGTRYYTYCFGIILVAPFALWFIGSMIRVLIRALEGKPVKWYGPVISACCTLAMLIAVFWDVYQIGQEATRLCNEKAGLHVYRTVKAESFLGAGSIKGWAEYGFKFVEDESPKGKFKLFIENGKSTYKKIDKLVSRYELVITRKNLTPEIIIHQYQIRDRLSHEVLGEAAQFTIDGGWADMAFYGLTGFTFIPWKCKGGLGDSDPFDIVTLVLRPNDNTH